MNKSEHIAHGYFFAKNYIIQKGFGEEIDWQNEINFDDITEKEFLNEISWVILSSGMKEKVIKKIFPEIRLIMFGFESAQMIASNKNLCYTKSLKTFNHSGKINAIIYAAEYLSLNSFDDIKKKIKTEGIDFLLTFPYLGNATAFHLAKNLGIDIAKPDRHLLRISNCLGYDDPNNLCKEISLTINEKICLIDLVLWRYATLDKNYVSKINWYINRFFINNQENLC